MNRIDKTFKKLKKEKKKAFISYVAAGDPDMKTSESIIEALAKSGSDIIEVGIPFSDPLADGPTIQEAIERSLKAGCTVKKVLSMVKRLRKKIDTPLVFMTYYNIVFNYGIKSFIKDAVKSGADGIIVPDLPMEESGELLKLADKEGFNVIMLTAPTTPPGRFKRIAAASRGFIYHVSLTGVTGARKKMASALKGDVRKLRKLTAKPVCVGFGVSSPAQARDVASSASGVIVGSAIIKVIEGNLSNKRNLVKKVSAFAGSMAKAVHRS
ncbi:tryptophan synthase subunit alpha [Candidatus Omnitrophota bacterium]